MLIINSNTYNPFFNIASEEYLFKEFNQNIFMVYQNSPSVIIGKNQNTYAEINYQYIKKNNIYVIRRLSGGGTVYHDLGNLNFIFITNGEKGKLVDFKKYIIPIQEIIKKFGIDVELGERNNLFIKGGKISGNAEHIFKNRVLHHGTLLFNTDLDNLIQVLKTDKEKFTDKAVKSAKSEVTNICNYISKSIKIEDFKKIILKSIYEKHPCDIFYTFSNKDKKAINKLIIDKYQTWEWNFGYSPKFSYQIKIPHKNKFLNAEIHVEKGIIENINFEKSEINKDLLNIMHLLKGVQFREEKIIEKMKQTGLFKNNDIKIFINKLF